MVYGIYNELVTGAFAKPTFTYLTGASHCRGMIQQFLRVFSPPKTRSCTVHHLLWDIFQGVSPPRRIFPAPFLRAVFLLWNLVVQTYINDISDVLSEKYVYVFYLDMIYVMYICCYEQYIYIYDIIYIDVIHCNSIFCSHVCI